MKTIVGPKILNAKEQKNIETCEVEQQKSQCA